MQMKRMAGSLVFLDCLCGPGNSRTSANSTACALYFSRFSALVRLPPNQLPVGGDRGWNLDVHRQIHLLLARVLLDHFNESVHSHVILTTVSIVRSGRSSARRWIEAVRLLCPCLDPACACDLPAAPNRSKLSRFHVFIPFTFSRFF